MESRKGLVGAFASVVRQGRRGYPVLGTPCASGGLFAPSGTFGAIGKESIACVEIRFLPLSGTQRRQFSRRWSTKVKNMKNTGHARRRGLGRRLKKLVRTVVVNRWVIVVAVKIVSRLSKWFWSDWDHPDLSP